MSEHQIDVLNLPAEEMASEKHIRLVIVEMRRQRAAWSAGEKLTKPRKAAVKAKTVGANILADIAPQLKARGFTVASAEPPIKRRI